MVEAVNFSDFYPVVAVVVSCLRLEAAAALDSCQLVAAAARPSIAVEAAVA